MNIVENESIVRINTRMRERVNAIYTTAFASCTMLRWLYPEPERYLVGIKGFLHYYAGEPEIYEKQTGIVIRDGDKGALIWQTDLPDDNGDTIMKFLLESVPPDRRDDTERVFSELGKYKPNEPFWYFRMLGVDPMYRKRNIGEMLTLHFQSICDEAKMTWFGDATNEATARHYERLGATVLAEVQCGSSPPFFPMMRRAQ